MTDPAPQVDPKMAALMKKLEMVKKILGSFRFLEGLLGLIMLFAPVWINAAIKNPSPSEGFPYMIMAPFLFALALGANMAAEDLAHAKVVFRTQAVAGLGMAALGLFCIIVFKMPGIFWLFVLAGLYVGGMAQYIIQQFKKMAGG